MLLLVTPSDFHSEAAAWSPRILIFMIVNAHTIACGASSGLLKLIKNRSILPVLSIIAFVLKIIRGSFSIGAMILHKSLENILVQK